MVLFMRVLSLYFLFFAFFSFNLQAQTAGPIEASEIAGLSTERLGKLNAQMHAFVDEGQLSGVQTAIFRKGQLAHFDTYGMADIESKTPLRDNSLWRIYSMTKPIVSVALMMLYEDGHFQLDDPLHKYIPEFKDMMVHHGAGKTGPAKNVIKVIDILRHTSGIGYGWGNGYVDSLYKSADRSSFVTTGDLSKGLTKIPLYYEPGTAWRYSLSTDICGYLVEVLSGESLDQFLAKNIFEPLGMQNTFFEIPENKKDQFITNYTTKEDGSLMTIDHPSFSPYTKKVSHFSGGGGLVSTTGDYLLFCQMLLNGGELKGERILSPKTIELMTKDHCKGLEHHGGPVVLPAKGTGFGLGFAVTEDLAASQITGSKGAYGWGGAAGTYFRIDPQEDMIFIMMIQLMPYNHLKAREKFHTMVYQAIIE